MDDKLAVLVLAARSVDRNLGKARQATALMTVINNASIKPIADHPLEQFSSNSNS
jgi:hypothetical protein